MSDATKFTAQLQGQRILIVGGTSGIGYAVAEACIENGMDVVVSSSRQTSIDSSLTSLHQSYPSLTTSKRLSAHVCNLNDADQLESNIETLLTLATNNQAQPLDHIVHTAGDALAVHSIHDTSLAKIHAAGMVRYYSVIILAKYAPAYMRSHGSFTLTTGAVATRPHRDWAVINGFATALIGLTRGLALDLMPLRVNCVEPGAVLTPLWNSLPEDQKQHLIKSVAAGTLTGKIARPEDIAESYLFFFKDANVTGTIVRTDGGATLL